MIHHKQHGIVGTPVKSLDCRQGLHCLHGVVNDQCIHPGNSIPSIYQDQVCLFAKKGQEHTLEIQTL